MKPKRKLTDAQENEIRRLYFKEKVDYKKICEDHKISLVALSKIIGGPASGRGFKPERSYA